MGHQVGGLLPRFPQQDAAAVGKAGPGLRLLELIPEQQFRLGVPPHIPAAQVIEGVIALARRQQHPGHPGGLVVLAADLVQLIGAVIDQLLPPCVVLTPARAPTGSQLVGQQQAGGVPVEPLGPSPVPLAVSRSQQAGPDLFRPAGREVLNLVQPLAGQRQGADHMAALSPELPLLQTARPHQLRHYPPAIVIAAARLPQQCHRHLAAEPHEHQQAKAKIFCIPFHLVSSSYLKYCDLYSPRLFSH